MLGDVPTTKLKHMAEMAAALDAGDMKDLRPAKRHALILALIRQMRIRVRDDVADMFIRRIGAVHKSAGERDCGTPCVTSRTSDLLVRSVHEISK